MTSSLLAVLLLMAMASTGMTAGAVIGLVKNQVAVDAPGNASRLALLAIVVTASWISIGLTVSVVGWGALADTSVALMGVLGMIIGGLPVMFALMDKVVVEDK